MSGYRDLNLTSLTLPLDVIVEMLKVIKESPVRLSPEASAVIKTEINHSYLLLRPDERELVEEIVESAIGVARRVTKGSEGSPLGLL